MKENNGITKNSYSLLIFPHIFHCNIPRATHYLPSNLQNRNTKEQQTNVINHKDLTTTLHLSHIQWFPTWGPQTIFGGPPRLRGPPGVRRGSAQKERGLQKVTIFLANDYLQYWFNYFLLQTTSQYRKLRRV